MLVSLGLVMFGMALGGSFTWFYFRELNDELGHELGESRKQLASSDADRTAVSRKLALRDRQLALAASQRDDYPKIASTLEIEAPRWGAGEWARKDRRYAGHPSENLSDLRGDFAPFAQEHV